MNGDRAEYRLIMAGVALLAVLGPLTAVWPRSTRSSAGSCSVRPARRWPATGSAKPSENCASAATSARSTPTRPCDRRFGHDRSRRTSPAAGRACASPHHEFWPCEVSLVDDQVIDRTRVHGPRQELHVVVEATGVERGQVPAVLTEGARWGR